LNIALYGTTGRIGRRILNEALSRGHHLIAITRDASTAHSENSNIEFRTGDVLKPESVAAATRGADVVVSAYGPGAGDADQITVAARSLVEGLAANQPMRLLVVGGAGSLEVSPGLELLDTPEFPPAHKKAARAHRNALAILAKCPFNWTCVSPSADIKEGIRTGSYRIGTSQLLFDEYGTSRISMEDFAVAIVDEVERPRFSRMRFTVGY